MKPPFCLVRTILACAALGASATAQAGQTSDLIHKAEAGDAKSQWELAAAYWQGTGVPQDPAKGFEWLQKSAAQGYAGAEVTLGVFYQNGVKGLKIEKDPHLAASWFRKAARQYKNDAKHAENAQADLAALATQGLITINEADWRKPEPGSEPVKPAKTNEGTATEAKSSKAMPFSLSEVEIGLTGGITTRRMSTLVSQYGVDFVLNENAKKKLTEEGADDALLQTLASSKR